MSKNLVGKTLGQYELVEIAGEGGLATVYKAYQRSLDRWVAVKVLHIQQEEVLARFKREAKVIALLRHRNILTVYEYGEQDGSPYIAMEYVEHGTLETHLKALQGKPMDLYQVISVSMAIADALDHAHQQGLVHRDIKPSNILMPQPDWPLLADFGLVKMTESQKSLTMTGVILGTPSYIAPEQALGRSADARSDMYALGVIMFEMITGRLPFTYKQANRQMLAHISEAPPAPRDLNPTCPPPLEAIILKAMEKTPDDRYANMQEMIEALRNLLGSSTIPIPSQSAIFDTPARPVSEFMPELAPAPPAQAEPVNDKRAVIQLANKNLTISLPMPGQAGLIIGRTHHTSHADVDLGPHGAAEAGISRRHARLIKSGQEWQIEDLGSLNGTYINNTKIPPGTPTPLHDGDTVRCSLLSFTFLLPED